LTNLNYNTDALVWAEEFMKTLREHNLEPSEDLMLGWFANAIMTGYDSARQKYEMVNAHETLMRHVLGDDYVESRTD